MIIIREFLAKLVHPLENWAERHVGGSMRSTLKQRHQMIDAHLSQLIQQHPQLQVLEIASGLSPRSWKFRQKFPELNYRELDLQKKKKIKTQALQQINPDVPEVLTGDIFSESFQDIFSKTEYSTQRLREYLLSLPANLNKHHAVVYHVEHKPR